MSSKVVALVTCDGCGESVEVPDAGTQPLPEGWSRFTFTDWRTQVPSGLAHTKEYTVLVDVHDDKCAVTAFGHFLDDRPEGVDPIPAPPTTNGNVCPVDVEATGLNAEIVCRERMGSEESVRNGIRHCYVHKIQGHRPDPELADAIKAGEVDYEASLLR